MELSSRISVPELGFGPERPVRNPAGPGAPHDRRLDEEPHDTAMGPYGRSLEDSCLVIPASVSVVGIRDWANLVLVVLNA